MKYHAVCHDCTAETVMSHKTALSELVKMHREETGHNVEFKRVD